MAKILIAGGRDFVNQKMLADSCNIILNQSYPDFEEIIIVTGKCKTGADRLGEAFARGNGYKIETYPADWNKHGKAAGPIRNEQMAKIVDRAIIFWDGKSKGTKNMIDMCQKHNRPYNVIYYYTNKIV